MPDGGIAGDALGQLHPFGGGPAFEQLLDAFVGEEQVHLQVDHRLAHHAEAEMARLDDAGMHRPDRDLVDAFALDRQEGIGRAIAFEIIRGDRIFAQRVEAFGPEGMAHQADGVGVPGELDAEHIVDLALQPRGREIKSRQRIAGMRRRRARRRWHARTSSGPGIGKQVVDFKHALVGAPVVGDHQDQLGLELGPQQLGQRQHVRRGPGRSAARSRAARAGQRCVPGNAWKGWIADEEKDSSYAPISKRSRRSG